jgi:hypothetical protein
LIDEETSLGAYDQVMAILRLRPNPSAIRMKMNGRGGLLDGYHGRGEREGKGYHLSRGRRKQMK